MRSLSSDISNICFATDSFVTGSSNFSEGTCKNVDLHSQANISAMLTDMNSHARTLIRNTEQETHACRAWSHWRMQAMPPW